jgi:hypothetical protein
MGAEKRRLIKKYIPNTVFFLVDKVTGAAHGHIKSGENKIWRWCEKTNNNIGIAKELNC